MVSLISLLSSPSSAKRRAAARKIGQSVDRTAGLPLYAAFLKEQQDPRTWETKVLMIHALGLLEFKEALPAIKEIVARNECYDMVTIAAGTAYVRLSRKSLPDAGPVLELLKFAKRSLAYGAFLALGSDRMVPSPSAIQEILAAAIRFGYEKGYGDARYGIAVAAAGWPRDLVSGFLEGCLTSPDTGLVYAAQNALKGKYIKCR